ncbi:hypothetical protein [Streptomyces sp. NPDC005865]|uniref:hypothetical protein n=1 Tax=Streptomyces sp. NPDC005865 TaxID=3155453 RepID=UPI0033C3444C
MDRQAVGATSGELAATYRGEGDAEGVTLTLKDVGEQAGSGTVTVHDSLPVAEGDGRTHLCTEDAPDACPAFRLRLLGD